jgi:hypothetical protein
MPDVLSVPNGNEDPEKSPAVRFEECAIASYNVAAGSAVEIGSSTCWPSRLFLASAKVSASRLMADATSSSACRTAARGSSTNPV